MFVDRCLQFAVSQVIANETPVVSDNVYDAGSAIKLFGGADNSMRVAISVVDFEAGAAATTWRAQLLGADSADLEDLPIVLADTGESAALTTALLPSTVYLEPAEQMEAKRYYGVWLTMTGDTETKAELDLHIGTTELDTIVEAHTAGDAGNDITITVLGDAIATVRITRVGTAFTIRYESGVSTIANIETAITALAGADNLFDVKTGGTGATVLSLGDDNVAVTALAGGYDDAGITVTSAGTYAAQSSQFK